MRHHAEDLIATCAEAYLTITPVYRLKQTDFKQSLARMFLKSVKVRDGQLQVVIGIP
jgi:mitochondrial fission protein ELM1